jgi:glycosyltransferase involved in cell wall biosynthesis
MASVTVIVPVLNEEKYLRDTLESVKAQTFKDYELIVVDNGSTDNSPQIAREYADSLVFESKRGSIAAMHRGIVEASGEYYVTCDADTIYPPDWLERMVRNLRRRRNVVAAYGPMAFREDGRFRRFLITSLYVVGDRLSLITGIRLSGGANLGVLREAYFRAGGYMVDSKVASQDFLLTKNLRKFGRVIFDPRMVIFTSNRRYARAGSMKGAFEAFRLWLDVALRRYKMTYDSYYSEDYYRDREKKGE